MLTEPAVKLRESKRAALIEVNQKQVRGMIVEFQRIAIHPQERGCQRDRYAFIAVDKRMILRQAFP